MVSLGLRFDPHLGFRFLVHIEGVELGGFSEVSGLAAEVEPFAYREGGLNEYEHQLAGPASYPPLVLKRGMTDGDFLWRWHEDVRRGRIVRRNGTILLCQPSGVPARAWDFHGAYPVRWSGPELRGDSATVAFESVELVHRGLSRR